jgi:hypothetical protein
MNYSTTFSHGFESHEYCMGITLFSENDSENDSAIDMETAINNALTDYYNSL